MVDEFEQQPLAPMEVDAPPSAAAELPRAELGNLAAIAQVRHASGAVTLSSSTCCMHRFIPDEGLQAGGWEYTCYSPYK